jgi:L-aspartate oxidase
MWRCAGIDRDAEGLRACLEAIDEVVERLPSGATEERNMAETARMIADAALQRRESRGGHFRSDFPKARRGWANRHIEF